MNWFIASNNQHKIREFQEILPNHKVFGPLDLAAEFNHQEIETSFAMNALGKATELWRLIQEHQAFQPGSLIIADDSGLVVPALGGAPGVYSARYCAQPGHPELTDHQRNQLLLANLQGVTQRQAYYVCSLVLVHGLDRFDCVQETWEGEIALAESQGTGGFGYDPLFYLPDLKSTVAELGEGIKSRISHRSKAVQRLIKFALD